MWWRKEGDAGKAREEGEGWRREGQRKAEEGKNRGRKIKSILRRQKVWNLAWWITPGISTPQKLRQKDCYNFKASLDHAVSFSMA